MSKPIIFPNRTDFAQLIERNGLDVVTSDSELFKVLTALGLEDGAFNVLGDCISCKVTEERNGAFELEIEYPVNGQAYDSIALQAIVGVKSEPDSTVQYFRINRVTRPISGIVTVYASHISYDLTGYICQPGWNANTPYAAMQYIKSHAVPSGCPFYMNSEDLGRTGLFQVVKPQTCRSLLGGQQGSILDVYGGELSYDNYRVILRKNRGRDRGVAIAYGKNLTDLTQEENCASVYTGVYPYWTGQDDALVQLPERVINADGNYEVDRVLPVDFSGNFEEQPTEEQLRQAAQAYIVSNNIGVPKVSVKVSFIDLAKTEEYKDSVLLEQIKLCDTVTVKFEKLGVRAKAKCIKTVYDALLDRFDSIELGDAKANLAQTIVKTEKTANSAVTKTAMEIAVDAATKAITGNLGGYVVLHDSNGDGQPDELLIMNTPSIDTATKVWRFNQQGLGYSSNGYAGPFGLAMTADGSIVADYITSGNLSANLINAGTITNEAASLSIDVSTGVINTSDTRYNVGNYSELSGVSLVQRIRKNGAEFDATHIGINGNNTAGQLILYDGSTVVFAVGRGVGADAHEIGVTVNGVAYTPMNVDYKDSRGESKTMRILCAGIY